MQKPTYILKNWKLFHVESSNACFLTGFDSTHKKIRTSFLLNIDFVNKKAETRNSVYILD